MDELVTNCLLFFHSNYTEILKIPIDLNCLSSKLVNKLTLLFSVTELSNFDDPKDKILNRLFLFKLDYLFSSYLINISRCMHCGELYCSQYQDMLECTKSKLSIGARGEFQTRHTPSKKFKPKKYTRLY